MGEVDFCTYIKIIINRGHLLTELVIYSDIRGVVVETIMLRRC